MSNKVILIIDDDSRNIFALSAVLRSRHYESISASDMKEAFVILNQRDDIGIILLDMMMPVMDGYEALPKIREIEKYKTVPIIAVTAQAMVGDRERCLNAGADNYISKPVDVTELFKQIDQFL
ncbi:response regulator [Gynurincola endophyticus]|jgi:CheY-like chemotaxis protein|uniref:response regulator n=1 Tax=Gynurincola endophyticus TaxID=2479004 RepID=UPI000F8DB62A|nr:response regulator [Gynurincola endophyticus]